MKPSKFYRQKLGLILTNSKSDSEAMSLTEELINELDDEFIDKKIIEKKVAWLKENLCEENYVDENDKKITCIDALEKQYYRKERCAVCEKIDIAFSDIKENQSKESKQ